jgi:hypothetical protein
MQSKTLMLRFGTMLVIAASLTLAACSSPGTPPSPADSTTPSVSVLRSNSHAPSKAAVVAACRQLLKQRQVHRPWAISVLRVEQEADGHWRASAWLREEPTSSYFGDVMVLAKDADGWRFVALEPLHSGGPGLPLSRPWSLMATPGEV